MLLLKVLFKLLLSVRTDKLVFFRRVPNMLSFRLSRIQNEKQTEKPLLKYQLGVAEKKLNYFPQSLNVRT
jgi:hypothetical protein